MSPLLRLLENEIQIAALLFMGIVYVFRILWILRFKPLQERTRPAGSAREGITYSLLSIALPRSMEGVRRKPGFYVQFIVFHLGVAAAIAATFIIPYSPGVFRVTAIVWIFQVVIGAALVVGLMRLHRRLKNPAIRRVSTPDDYFSLLLMIVYFAAAIPAVPNRFAAAEWPLVLFFGLTAFFLISVPFSKISHYLYYPFARFLLGKTLGHRGVFPLNKTPQEASFGPPEK
jgi:nitrate reductase gamma subunit